MENSSNTLSSNTLALATGLAMTVGPLAKQAEAVTIFPDVSSSVSNVVASDADNPEVVNDNILANFAATGETFFINGDFIGALLTNNSGQDQILGSIDFTAFDISGGQIGLANSSTDPGFLGTPTVFDASGDFEDFLVPAGASVSLFGNNILDDSRSGLRNNEVQQGGLQPGSVFDAEFPITKFNESSFTGILPQNSFPSFTLNGPSVPEPSSLGLVALGAMAGIARRKR